MIMNVKQLKELLDGISDGDDFAEVSVVDAEGREIDLVSVALDEQEGEPTRLVFKTGAGLAIDPFRFNVEPVL
jgi:hypothetical protein